MPRLELLNCLILSRRGVLKNPMFISDELHLLDSEVAPAWIRNADKEYKQYVHNRVAEIRKLSNAKVWYHVREKENIADLQSRGCSIKKLVLEKEWIEGSLWLKDDRNDLPISNLTDAQLGENELKKAATDENTKVLTTLPPKHNSHSLGTKIH